MARIRTIKPEFPHSESMGMVSRDARLLFIMLWTLADDEGRLRGNSRMLASLLFPYDGDAPKLIDGWLGELEAQSCIVRYLGDGSTYLEIRNWLNHQKIDRPSKSKIPPFDEASRIVANPREPSCLDQGSRIKDQGSKESPPAIPLPRKKRLTPLPDDFGISPRVQEWAESKGYRDLHIRLEHFVSYAKRSGKTYADWDEAFMASVRDDWAKLSSRDQHSDSGHLWLPHQFRFLGVYEN